MMDNPLEKRGGCEGAGPEAVNIPACGVESLASVRFWLVLCCYLGSALLALRDPFFWQGYHFTLPGVLPFLLAFVLASDLNWELLLTGKPKGCNLFLQVAMIVPLTLLVSRTVIPYQAVRKEPGLLQSIFDKAHEAVNTFAQSLHAWIPNWLLELVCHPWLGILLIGILLILCIKSHFIRLPMLLLVVMVMAGSTIVTGCGWHFVLAAIAFVAGIAFQWNPYGKISFLLNVHRRLGHQAGDAVMFQAIMETMEKLYERGELNGREFEQIVQNRYAPHLEYTRDEQRLIMNEILRRMVEGYRLVTLEVTISGTTMHPVQELYECNRLLANMTIVPRFVAVAVIAIVWTAMPFDALPDSIPFVGLLDDLAVCWLSAWIGKDSVKRIKEHSHSRQEA